MKKYVWKGYSFDELCYQQSLSIIRCEIANYKLLNQLNAIKQSHLSLLFRINNKYSVFLNKLSYINNYISLYKIGKSIYSIIKHLHNKK